MFVITADQIGSRGHADIVAGTIELITERHGARLALPVDRNAGDELQAMTAEPHTALQIALELTRSAQWSVGLGCGAVRTPLPHATREATGPAFFAARDAVTRAKKQPTRFAVEAGTDEDRPGAKAAGAPSDTSKAPWPAAADAESLITLLLLMRARRSDAGWELYDLLATGMQQNDAARRLGISAPAANSRARVAGIKAELASVGALTRLLENLDRTVGGRHTRL